MTDIINPLDDIIEIINDLASANHTNRRGSNLESAYSKILSKVNLAKNNIIKHLLDKNSHKVENVSYAQIVKPTPANNIIIPVSDKKPDSEAISNVEERVNNILKSSDAYVIKSTATHNGNIVLKVKNHDKIEDLNKNLVSEFGENIKIQKPLDPKIKLTSLPSYFDTSNKETIVARIVEKNSYLKEQHEKNNECMQYLFTYNTNGHKTIVLKCSPDMRCAIKNHNDNLNIDCFKCKVYDHFHILQCSKCCKFGHTFKNCKAEKTICTFCSKDHSFKNCSLKNKNDTFSCYNCLSSSDTTIKQNAHSHQAFSKNCPFAKNEKAKVIAKTNFGFNYTHVNT